MRQRAPISLVIHKELAHIAPCRVHTPGGRSGVEAKANYGSSFSNAFPDRPYPGNYLPCHPTFDLSFSKQLGKQGNNSCRSGSGGRNTENFKKKGRSARLRPWVRLYPEEIIG
jgi:hypothetical protein